MDLVTIVLIPESLGEQIIGGGISSISTTTNSSSDVSRNASVSDSVSSSFFQVNGSPQLIDLSGDPFAFSETLLYSIA